MSALRHGKIERAIANQIADAVGGTVLVTSGTVAFKVFELYEHWDGNFPHPTPTLAQRNAVTRAMHSFVRKHQQYALMGGQGRRALHLYDTGDPLSVMWAKLNVERRRGKPISRSDAKEQLRLEAEHDGNTETLALLKADDERERDHQVALLAALRAQALRRPPSAKA